MKSHTNLWPRIVSWENLYTAARRAALGKRGRGNVARFEVDLEKEVCLLRRELVEGTYRPGPYRTFYIHEPKVRLISAAPFRDRVVHHALCAVIEPLFERRFITDSYASRKGKGTPSSRRRRRHNCSPGRQSGVPGPPLDLSRRRRRHNRDPGRESGASGVESTQGSGGGEA